MPDTDAAITRVAVAFARRWQHAAVDITDRARKEATLKWAVRLERRDAMNNMLAVARALKPLSDPGDRWDANAWLLGTPNGVIDLARGTLRPGRPDDQITMATAVGYDQAATCPRWTRFLVEVFAQNRDLVDFVQRAIGYSLTGLTSEQVLFLLYGTGANGKGTLVNTLQGVLGDYAWNMPFATIEMRDRATVPNDLAALVSRRFVTASETNDGTRLNEARVKALTGSDPITARFLHSEFFTFEPAAKFWLSVNHQPVVRDDSFGFWRRIRLIPFTQTFAVNQRLGDELAQESAGILRWAVDGAQAWRQRGLDAPPIVMAATAEYEKDSDPLSAFLDEACVIEADAHVGASELFKHYREWADHAALTPHERLNATSFGRKLSERFDKVPGRSGKLYLGVAKRTV